MAVGIPFHHRAGIPFPVIFCLPWHQIILVCQGPPDIFEMAQPVHRVFQIEDIRLRIHSGKSPFVIRMKQNQIRLNPQLIQLLNSPFQIVPESRAETGEIKTLCRVSLERRKTWIFRVVSIKFRENTHPHLIEPRVFQCGKGLLLYLLRLINPGIAGGAKGQKPGSILVSKAETSFIVLPGEIPAGRYLAFREHTAMVSFLRRHTVTDQLHLIKDGRVRMGDGPPAAGAHGHETDFIYTASAVKTIDGELFCIVGKISLQPDIPVRISLIRAGKGGLVYFILLSHKFLLSCSRRIIASGKYHSHFI